MDIALYTDIFVCYGPSKKWNIQQYPNDFINNDADPETADSADAVKDVDLETSEPVDAVKDADVETADPVDAIKDVDLETADSIDEVKDADLETADPADAVNDVDQESKVKSYVIDSLLLWFEGRPVSAFIESNDPSNVTW